MQVRFGLTSGPNILHPGSIVLQGWLLLLECYSRLMYRPSTDFEGALERYCLGVLPGLGPEALASLVGSAARLQLPLSPQLEDGIITRLEQVWWKSLSRLR
jgi:hypothetical protein